MKLKACTAALALGLLATTVNAATSVAAAAHPAASTSTASAQTANAQVAGTLTSALGVEVLFVNGVDADDLSEPFVLADGTNQIVVEVSKSIGRGDKRTQVNSAPYIIGLNTKMGLSAKAGQLYIDMPSFKDRFQAEKRFAQQTMDWEVTVNDQAMEYSQYKMPGKKGAFPYANLDQQLAQYNEANGVFFARGKRVELAELQAVSATSSTNQKVRQVTLPMTKAKIAYLEMSDAERQTFLTWAKQQ